MAAVSSVGCNAYDVRNNALETHNDSIACAQSACGNIFDVLLPLCHKTWALGIRLNHPRANPDSRPSVHTVLLRRDRDVVCLTLRAWALDPCGYLCKARALPMARGREPGSCGDRSMLVCLLGQDAEGPSSTFRHNIEGMRVCQSESKIEDQG